MRYTRGFLTMHGTFRKEVEQVLSKMWTAVLLEGLRLYLSYGKIISMRSISCSDPTYREFAGNDSFM